MYENICIDYKVAEAKTSVEMLKTIALPKDLKELNRQLPKPNYHTCSNKIGKVIKMPAKNATFRYVKNASVNPV